MLECPKVTCNGVTFSISLHWQTADTAHGRWFAVSNGKNTANREMIFTQFARPFVRKRTGSGARDGSDRSIHDIRATHPGLVACTLPACIEKGGTSEARGVLAHTSDGTPSRE